MLINAEHTDELLANKLASLGGKVEREVKGKLKARVKDQVMQVLLDATKLVPDPS